MSEQHTSQTCIGIDLGTSSSSVAYWTNTYTEIIPNDYGERPTPSYVSFYDKERLIGSSAQCVASRNPHNTIFNFKRLIGRKFDEPELQNYIKSLPFTIINSPHNTPLIQVSHNEETRLFSVEEITSMLLKYLQSIASDWFSLPISNCVISVPANFNYFQRQSTRNAAEIAGLNTLQLINEPTAVAIKYAYDRSNKFIGNILVVDFGGGSYDASVISLHKNTIKVLASAGSTYLGGEDLDAVLVDYLLKELKSEYKHVNNLEKPWRAKRRLKTQCERAKRTLSHVYSANIEIDCLQPSIDFVSRISRSRYQLECMSYFESCIEYITIALNDAGIKKTDLDDVLLMGGLGRDAVFREIVAQYFNPVQINASCSDTIMLHGTAILAAILNGDIKEKYNIIDIASSAVHFVGDDNIKEEIITKGAPLPSKVMRRFITTEANQSGFNTFSVYADGDLHGVYALDGIPAAPQGSTVSVVFDVNSSAILSVDANCNEILSGMLMDRYIAEIKQLSLQYMPHVIKWMIVQYGNFDEMLSNVPTHFEFKCLTSRLTVHEMKDKMRNLQKLEEEQRLLMERANAKNKLEDIVYEMQNLENTTLNDLVCETDKRLIQQAAKQIMNWLDDNPKATMEEYKAKETEFQDLWKQIIQNCYSVSMPSYGGMPPMPCYNCSGFATVGPKIDDVD